MKITLPDTCRACGKTDGHWVASASVALVLDAGQTLDQDTLDGADLNAGDLYCAAGVQLLPGAPICAACGADAWSTAQRGEVDA